jgi:hypothetical protein
MFRMPWAGFVLVEMAAGSSRFKQNSRHAKPHLPGG